MLNVKLCLFGPHDDFYCCPIQLDGESPGSPGSATGAASTKKDKKYIKVEYYSSSSDKKESQRIDKQIERELTRDRRTLENELKLLVLGESV